MYAVVQQGGHQYRVAPGDRLMVDQLDAPVGSVVALAPVLLVQDDSRFQAGAPAVEGARVAARVVAHRFAKKIRVFTFKPKKRHRRTQGYRSHVTELQIEALLAAGEPLPVNGAAATETAPAPARRPRARRAAAGAAAPEVEQEAVPAAAAAAEPDAAAAAEPAADAAAARPARRRTRRPAAEPQGEAGDAQPEET